MYSCWSCRGSAGPLNTWVGVGWGGGGYLYRLTCGHVWCLCACFYCMCHILSYNRGKGLETRWPRFSDVTQCKCCLHPLFALWRVCGWWWKAGGPGEVLGQLRLCPTSADHISPIHPCHADDVACMCVCVCLTFRCNENSICGTSDMVDVSCPHYSLLILVWGATQIAHSQTHTNTHPQSPWREKKRQMFHHLTFSGEIQWQAELLNPALSNLSETTFWHFSPSTIKSHQKTYPNIFLPIVPWM